jgi:hypothetical protein
MSGKLTALTYNMDMVRHVVALKWFLIVFIFIAERRNTPNQLEARNIKTKTILISVESSIFFVLVIILISILKEININVY